MVDVFLVGKETLNVGRQEPCNITCDIDELSSKHIGIKLEENIPTLIMYGKNGGYINGKFLGMGGKYRLNFADEIELHGLTLIWLSEEIAACCDKKYIVRGLKKRQDENTIINASDENRITDDEILHSRNRCTTSQNEPYFLKSPRTYYAIDTETIELEAPPQKHVEENQSKLMTIFPALTMALPMTIGFFVSRLALKGGSNSSVFMYTGVITAVCSAMLGVVLAVTNMKNRRRQIMINEKKRQKMYRQYVKSSEALIREKYNKNVSSLRIMYPELSEYIKERVNNNLLWNREITDEDFLFVRLGTGDIPCNLNVTIPKERFSVTEDDLRNLPKVLKQSYSVLKDVPVTVDIRQNSITSVISGDNRHREEMVLSIIMNLSVAVSPSDLKVLFDIHNGMLGEDMINSIRFLPHLISGTEIGDIIQNRNIVLILFTDNQARDFSNYMSENELYTVFISDSFDNIPVKTSLIIQSEQWFSGYLNISKNNRTRREVHFDRISVDEAEHIARTLQAVRLKKTVNNKLPDTISYYELFDTKITKDTIGGNWVKNHSTEKILAPLGILESREILCLDFHENGHGPHGLIAGMTGSGKSEILQTLILSLCVNYSPENVCFFLIDYKGGGMAALFDDVPHVMGSISNLSGRMISRAMASVKSENERRQKRFNDFQVNNISAYQRLYDSGKIAEPMPHIFIIIDEFAELKKEEPDFMKELISVARVGRSLGVHLILATQKPAGVVDDNILGNSRFRICLRVQDRMDSMEVIKKPDATSIVNPGRAILQVGNDELYLHFQGAYTMAKANGSQSKKYLKINDLMGMQYREHDDFHFDSEGETQLCQVLNDIKEVYNKTSLKRGSPLWLEPLKKEIFMISSDQTGNEKTTERFEIRIGIYDDPSHQNQDEYMCNLNNTGHLIVLGGLRSGKSTLMAVISKSIINNSRNDFFNIYYIDFSNGILNMFSQSKMCCGYVDENNEEDISRLFIHISEVISTRKEKLQNGNYWQYIKNKTPQDEEYLPPVVIFIDGLGSFRERTSGCFDKELETILKTSETLGVIVIASAINLSSHEIPKRMFDCFKTCIPLTLKDRYEYKDALNISYSAFILPEETPGRGLAKIDDQIVEFQTYQTLQAESDFDRSELLREEIKKSNGLIDELYGSQINKLVNEMPRIPDNLTIKSFHLELDRRKFIQDASAIPAGFFTESGKVFSIPVADKFVVIISGRRGSGKNNFLKVIGYEMERLRLNYVNRGGSLLLDNDMEIIVMDDDLSFDERERIKKRASDDPYVIHLGGALDRQNNFDFSYIPYSKQINTYKPGTGTVRKTDKGYAYGSVIIPEFS